MEEKNKYIEPKISVVCFVQCDVITTSDEQGGAFDGEEVDGW